MAQRRSKNRRLSARKSNVSGFLNEDTNVYDNNDPLWYDRTAVRPSTSLRVSKNTTAVLDPDSTVHMSQLPNDWFDNLSQSESSKLLQEAVKKKSSQQHQEPAASDHGSAATESESEHEFQKKRANLRSTKKQSNNIDKSNAFMKALEKTTDSYTRNLTHAQMLEGNESESTHDDSRTVRKLRPKFTRHAKNDTNNFDKALESDSASERVETSRRSLRSTFKRFSEAIEEFATSEKQQRLTKSTGENIVDASHAKKSVEKVQNKSVNKTKDKEIAESSIRGLRNRNIVISPAKSATPAKSPRQSSGTKKRPAEDQLPDSSPGSPEVRKHKRQLFSQGHKTAAEKSKGDKSAFDAALDSVNDSQHLQEKDATITEARASTSKANEQSKTPEDDNDNDDSDSSSIPQNIRRTRSRSLFGERKSGETGNVNSSKNKSRIREKDSSKNASQFLKDKSAANESITSDKQESTLKNMTIAESSDDEEDIYYNTSLTRRKAAEQAKDQKSESAQSRVSSVETDSEDMIDASPSKTKQSEANQSDRPESDKQLVSSVETSDDEDMINMSNCRIEQQKVDTSKKSNESSGKANKSRASKSTSSVNKNQDIPSSPDLSNGKSRSRLFQKKNTSKDENAFDRISFNKSSWVKEKSKEKEMEETPRLSQRSPKATIKSRNNQLVNASKNKSSSRENTKNDSKADDESEDETSTIPQHIRRTRSRLFQKSKANDDDNAFEDALDAENVPENRNELSQKSRMSNKSNTNKSASSMRDAGASKSVLKAMKKKPKIIIDKTIQLADSTGLSSDNPKKNQESKRSSPRTAAPDISLSKEKSVNNSQDTASSDRNSQDAVSDRRSVETSSDGTPAPTSPKQASTPFAAPSTLLTKPSKRVSVIPSSAKSAQNSSLDDLLYTPNPAQSTLNPNGKPVNRITQFSFRRTSADLEERTPPAAAETSKSRPNALPENNDDVDMVDDSQVSNCPLLIRLANDIPSDKENSQVREEASIASKSPKKKKTGVRKSNDGQNKEHPIDWEKAKQHTDAVKVMVEAQMRLAEEARKKRELEKQRIDMKVKRLQAQREAELKRKNKKPIHKAFLVDGKVYKQPQLPHPKPWATNRLYNYLWKKMEPKYGKRTRVKSEEFVVQLSDFATRIDKRKNFENYRHQLDEIMMTMAKLGIIRTRFDFYRFTADFLPYRFREKVNPMAMPGNERNIPYDRELLYKRLLNDSTDEASDPDVS